MTAVSLGPHDIVPGRPVTDPEHTSHDTVILESIRDALRRHVADGGSGGTWRDPSGDGNLLVIPDVVALSTGAPAAAVGFFGQARDDVDHTPITRIEQALLRRAASFGGLLAYYNVHFAERGQWGNLVVFGAPDDPGRMAGDAQHQQAIRLTPVHYRSLRLHRYALRDGALGLAPLEWVRTTYLDFADDPPWRGVREG